MVTYKAMHKYVVGGVHAEVLDFPGTISWGVGQNQRGQHSRIPASDARGTYSRQQVWQVVWKPRSRPKKANER